jgi:hypothetical protein
MQAYFSVDMIFKYLVILFSYAWGGVEIFRQVKQRKQHGDASAPMDRGSLIFLYVCIALGYSMAIPISFSPYGRLTWGQPYWLVFGVVWRLGCIAIFVIRDIWGNYWCSWGSAWPWETGSPCWGCSCPFLWRSVGGFAWKKTRCRRVLGSGMKSIASGAGA